MTTCEADLSDALLAQTGWLRALVRSLVRDTAQVDDVCQATLLEALRLQPRHDRSLRPWLARVARHVSIAFDRRERQRPSREAAARPRACEPSPAEVLERVTWHQTVVNAVMALGEPYRSTILMRFWEDADAHEISRRMGVPVETVRTRLKRGIALLRRRLDRDVGDRRVWFTALVPLAVGGRAVVPLTLALMMTTKKLLVTAAALVATATLVYLNWPDAAVSTPVAAAAPDEVAPLEPAASKPLVATTDLRAELRPDEPGEAGASEVLDPAIAAALCGFRGRIVTAGGEPESGCPVQIYRVSTDSFFALGGDILEDGGRGPRLVHHDTVTDSAGRFFIRGIWPRATNVLFAGGEHSGRTMRILDRNPDPGEIVDLGDIELTSRAVVTGTVVDEEGDPVAGALVRGVDLPSVFFQALPLARFDPDGVLINRDPSVSLTVAELPTSLRELYAHLPIVRTHTDAEGRFRLVGLPRGVNVVMVHKHGYLSAVKPRVKLDADTSRDVGRISLREGEEVLGKVVDAEGKPVPGAQVAAAPTSAMVPVDLGGYLESTDAEGRFHGEGFPSGRVTVAARRGPGQQWVVARPESVDEDIVVRLAAVDDLDIRVTSETGRELTDVSVEILRGALSKDLVAMRRTGFATPVDIGARLEPQSSSVWRVRGLELGRYSVIVAAAGHGASFKEIDFGPATELKFELDVAAVFKLRVTNSAGVPLPQSEVFARPADHTVLTAVTHVNCGRTDAEGRLEITKIQADKALVAVTHPAYGMAEAVLERDRLEQQVVMQTPGSIAGKLLEDNRIPEPGKWVVFITGRPQHGENILKDTPRFAPVTAGGHFEFGSLQPGLYELRAIESAGMTGSFTGLLGFARDLDVRPFDVLVVKVAAGTVATAAINLGTPAPADAGTNLAGTVSLNGAVGAGMLVRLSTTRGKTVAQAITDRRGAFDLGPVEIETGVLRVYSGKTSSSKTALYDRIYRQRQHAGKKFEIRIHTASLAGAVLSQRSKPVAGANVMIRRKIDAAGGFLQFKTKTGAAGGFAFGPIPTGRYSVHVREDGTPAQFAPVQNVTLSQGGKRTGLVFTLRWTLRVTGRVDLAALKLDDATKVTLKFMREEKISDRSTLLGDGPRVPVRADGSFTHEGLTSGTYRVELRAGESVPMVHRGKIVLADTDLLDVELKEFVEFGR